MKDRKPLFLWVPLVVVVLAVAVWAAYAVMRPSPLPSGVTIDGPRVSSVTPTPSEAPLTSTEAPADTAPPVSYPEKTLEELRPLCAPDELNPDCWNTEPDSGGVPLVPGDNGEVFDVSPSSDSEHGYDVIVFNVGTLTDVQFEARYVPSVSHDASGAPVDVHGGAVLQLVIHAPSNPELFNGFDFQGSAANYAALREIKYAGTFEGQTTFAIGVDHQVRFAVTSGPDGSSGTDKVIVYLAHE